MRGPHYDSSDDSADALKNKYKISRKLVNELFNSIEEEADSLVSDYGREDEGEQGVMREYLKIAFAEDIVLFIDEGLWEAEDGVRWLLDDPEST